LIGRRKPAAERLDAQVEHRHEAVAAAGPAARDRDRHQRRLSGTSRRVSSASRTRDEGMRTASPPWRSAGIGLIKPGGIIRHRNKRP
jgi:hypothetical protein